MATEWPIWTSLLRTLSIFFLCSSYDRIIAFNKSYLGAFTNTQTRTYGCTLLEEACFDSSASSDLKIWNCVWRASEALFPFPKRILNRINHRRIRWEKISPIRRVNKMDAHKSAVRETVLWMALTHLEKVTIFSFASGSAIIRSNYRCFYLPAQLINLMVERLLVFMAISRGSIKVGLITAAITFCSLDIV